jgi:hypothetical protein
MSDLTSHKLLGPFCNKQRLKFFLGQLVFQICAGYHGSRFKTFFSISKQFGGVGSSPATSLGEIPQEEIDHLIRGMPQRPLET